MLKLSKRARQLTPSATLAMAAKAKKLKAEGKSVLNFAMGEPDFDTPLRIKEAAKRSIDQGETKYAPPGGIPELKAAIRQKFLRDNGLTYAANEIVVSCGAKDAIFNALMALIDEDDEVIIPAPYWVSFPEQVKLCGGIPRIVATSEAMGFRLTPELLEKNITSQTRAVILNTPCNPTGSAYSREELATLARVIVNHGITIISDEIYEKLTYGGFVHTSIASTLPQVKEQTIVINGVSKAYAMTGWRMGYAAGPAEVIAKMEELEGQQITSIPCFVQRACVEAIAGPQDDVKKMVAEFEARRDLMITQLKKIPGIRCHVPQGAFYLFPNIEAYLGKQGPHGRIDDASALAEYLLDTAHVAVVSGDPFGAPGYLRLSSAASRKQIEEGTERLKEAFAKLK